MNHYLGISPIITGHGPHGPLNQKVTLSCKTLDFYFKLLLLLEIMKHSQSIMQHCPRTTEVCRFPNFTSEAGSPFVLKLPTPPHLQLYQVSWASLDKSTCNIQHTHKLWGLCEAVWSVTQSSACCNLLIYTTSIHEKKLLIYFTLLLSPQLSLADRDGTLPHWMVFRRETSSLAGLALTEDCGIYHLKVFVIGEQHAAYFYLHILNRTVTDKDSAR